MAKQWPDYMGTYKGMVMEWGVGRTKNGFPRFMARVYLTEYYDQKEQTWYDVSENNWTVNAYLPLFGREGSRDDGDLVPTLNHQQVIKVFGWDGCGFGYLSTTDFQGKVIQVRLSENTAENAKTPCQVEWIDVEDTDPSSTLRKLDAKDIKDLDTEFEHLWKSQKKVTPVTAKKTVAAPKPMTAKKTEPPVTDDLSADGDGDPPTDDKAAKKKALLARSKRLLEANKKEIVKVLSPPAKGKPVKTPEPESVETTEPVVPDGYGKKAAWSDVVEMKSPHCNDEQLHASWNAAIAEIAEDGDEDKLDTKGWWAVKECVLADIGVF